MALNYQKTNWVNNETKLNPANMNKIEDGIKNASDQIDGIVSTIHSANYMPEPEYDGEGNLTNYTAHYIHTDGSLNSSALNMTSDYFDVPSSGKFTVQAFVGSSWTIPSFRTVAFYNEDKIFISAVINSYGTDIPNGTKFLRVSIGKNYITGYSNFTPMFVINEDGSLLNKYIDNCYKSTLNSNTAVSDSNLTDVSEKHKKSLRVSALSQLFTSYVGEEDEDYIFVKENYNDKGYDKTAYLYSLYDALMEKYPDYITRTQIATTDAPNLEERPVYTDAAATTVNTHITSESIFPMYRYDFNPSIAHRTNNTVGLYGKVLSLPKILYTGGIHGGECQQVFAAYRFFKMLCEKWDKYELLSDLRWNAHFVVIPLNNPFGFNFPSGRYNADGVNIGKLNENHVDISGNFPSDNYVSGTDGKFGTSALSEPESRALYEIIQNEDFIMSIDNHTFGYLGTQYTDTVAGSTIYKHMAGYFVANHNKTNSTEFWFKISRWLNQRIRKISPTVDSTTLTNSDGSEYKFSGKDLAELWCYSDAQMLSNTFRSVGANIEMLLSVDPINTGTTDGATPYMPKETQAFLVDELAIIFYEALQDFYTY